MQDECGMEDAEGFMSYPSTCLQAVGRTQPAEKLFNLAGSKVAVLNIVKVPRSFENLVKFRVCHQKNEHEYPYLNLQVF